MHDQQIILGGGEVDGTTTRNKILQILWESYGKEEVLQWGIAVLERIQQTDILRQGMYEDGVSLKATKWEKLDGGTLVCPQVVAGWLLRDMRKREECGCASQGWKSAEQRTEQFAEAVQELSHESASSCEDMFSMWSKGERLGILQQTLYQIQKIRRSVNGSKGGDGMKDVSTVVRRLTPL